VRRGEVFHLAPPQGRRGHEQTGRRYGVVVQAEELMALSTVVIAPTSPSALPATFRPEVTIRGRSTRVLVEQLGAVDPARLGRPAGLLPPEDMRSVDDALAVVLGLP
jgi:mRNA interferase MazF